MQELRSILIKSDIVSDRREGHTLGILNQGVALFIIDGYLIL